MMILNETGTDDIAKVYLADMGANRIIEFVESVQPPIPREEKWVLIVSTLFGCPVGCSMCDAGGDYGGPLSAVQILEQIDLLIRKRYPDGRVPASKFKVQFARMGEPALNPAVLEVLQALPDLYDAPGLIPSISTIAPAGNGPKNFFENLKGIKNDHFGNGRFQLQFSLHTTDENRRDELIPVTKWSFSEIAEYGDSFYQKGDRKITLNFALARGMPLDGSELLKYFSPEKYLIKITPLNPTYRAMEHGLESYVDPLNERECIGIINELRGYGYDVLLSIGEVEENRIGSNCGQYVRRFLAAREKIEGAYEHQLKPGSN